MTFWDHFCLWEKFLPCCEYSWVSLGNLSSGVYMWTVIKLLILKCLRKPSHPPETPFSPRSSSRASRLLPRLAAWRWDTLMLVDHFSCSLSTENASFHLEPSGIIWIRHSHNNIKCVINHLVLMSRPKPRVWRHSSSVLQNMYAYALKCISVKGNRPSRPSAQTIQSEILRRKRSWKAGVFKLALEKNDKQGGRNSSRVSGQGYLDFWFISNLADLGAWYNSSSLHLSHKCFLY